MGTLGYYWDLADLNAEKRIKAGKGLVLALAEIQKQYEEEKGEQNGDKNNVAYTESELSEQSANEVAYAIKRLVKGMTSSRDGARQGFCMVLIEILRNNQHVTTRVIMEIMKTVTESKSAAANGSSGGVSGQELRDKIFGKLFVIFAVIASGLLTRASTTSEDIKEVVMELKELGENKKWLREAGHEGICKVLGSVFSNGGKSGDQKEQKEKLAKVAEVISSIVFGQEGKIRNCDELKVYMEMDKQLKLRERESGSKSKNSKVYKLKINEEEWVGGNVFDKRNIDRLSKLLIETNKQMPIGGEEGADMDVDMDADHGAGSEYEPHHGYFHSVWYKIIEDFGTSNKRASKGTKGQDVGFNDIWKTVVDEGYFGMETSTTTRKFWGFQLIKYVLELDSESNTGLDLNLGLELEGNSEKRKIAGAVNMRELSKSIFTKNTAAALARQVVNKKSKLNGIANKIVERIQELVESSDVEKDGEVNLGVLIALELNKEVDFDKISNRHLIKQILNGQTANVQNNNGVNIKNKGKNKPKVNNENFGRDKVRMVILRELLKMQCDLAEKPKIPTHVVELLVKLTNEEVLHQAQMQLRSAGVDKVQQIQDNSKEFLVKVIDMLVANGSYEKLLSVIGALMKSFNVKARGNVNKNANVSASGNNAQEELMVDITRRLKINSAKFIIDFLQRKQENEENAGRDKRVKELVFMLGIQDFVDSKLDGEQNLQEEEEEEEEDEEDNVVNPEINEIIENIDNSDKLVTVLVDLLSSKTAFLRPSIQLVFREITSKISKQGIDELVSAIKGTDSSVEQEDEGEDIDGEDIDGDDEEDQEDEESEDDEEDDDDDDEEEEEEEDQEEEEGDDDDNNDDEDEDDDDEEEMLLDDDQMLQFDSKLSELFKLQKKNASATNKKHLQQIQIHYKLRVLDLVSLYLSSPKSPKSTKINPHSFYLISQLLPLLPKLKEKEKNPNQALITKFFSCLASFSSSQASPNLDDVTTCISTIMSSLSKPSLTKQHVESLANLYAVCINQFPSSSSPPSLFDNLQPPIVDYFTNKNSNVLFDFYTSLVQKAPHLSSTLDGFLSPYLDFYSSFTLAKSFRYSELLRFYSSLSKLNQPINPTSLSTLVSSLSSLFSKHFSLPNTDSQYLSNLHISYFLKHFYLILKPLFSSPATSPSFDTLPLSSAITSFLSFAKEKQQQKQHNYNSSVLQYSNNILSLLTKSSTSTSTPSNSRKRSLPSQKNNKNKNKNKTKKKSNKNNNKKQKLN